MAEGTNHGETDRGKGSHADEATSETDAYQTIGKKMEQLGFARNDKIEDHTKIAYQAGHAASAMHETCADPNCGICAVRHKIEGNAFQRGLEKGMRLAAAMGRHAPGTGK